VDKLFELQTMQDLVRITGITVPELQSLANSMDRNVNVALEPKERGGFRKICKPSFRLKQIQRTINKKILQPIPLPPFLHGAVKGKSTKGLAQQHIGKPFILTVDIKDFYPNIHYSRILRIFHDIGFSDNIARLLTKLCTYDYCLAQGFPTSSSLANLTLARLAPRIKGIEKHHQVKVSSWQDDLIISGGYRIRALFSLVERIMRQEGFVLHLGEKKKLMVRGQRQQIVGYVINVKVNVSKEYYRNLRMTIHLCKVKGIEVIAGNTPVEKFRKSLMGRIQYIAEVNPARGKQLLAEFEAL
jgi:RNA-directed DNA polymerase